MQQIISGVYPAMVTPFGTDGRIDGMSVAKLCAYFESAGCRGVVLAGTNGEGPSLSAYEKRELLQTADSARGKLNLILGIATPSLSEAHWLCSQAYKHGAEAVLVMPPGYFRSVSDAGIVRWFSELLDKSPIPVLLYNFPKMTGITLTAAMVRELSAHPQVAGLKDSSGEVANLSAYREAMSESHALFVGDETLLIHALESGWTGTISGAANIVPRHLSRIVDLWNAGNIEQARIAFKLVLPVIEAVRTSPQPVSNKAVLHALGVISTDKPKAPLESVDPAHVLNVLAERLGIRKGDLGISAPE